jgi:hypothetical protein
MINVFDMSLSLTCLPLSLLLILSTIGSAWSSGANNTAVNGTNNTAINDGNNTAVNGTNNTAVNFDDTSLQKLLAEYHNWDLNIPTEQLNE